MKLRRRRKEGCHHAFCLHQAAAAAIARSVLALLLPSSSHSLSLHHSPPASALSAVPACLPPRAAKQLLQLSPPQLFRFSFLLHKITEAARYGIRRVALYSTCRPNLPVQLAGLAIAAPSSPHLAPSPNQVPRLLSGSNGILSVEDGAIGNQRPKMRFPVSFPSLLNK